MVLVHLNHRLVQMCLRLLRAEVWSDAGRKRLHRIAARVVPDSALPTPAVIAHARLVVIGGDSHRLHEEIITAGGMLKEGRFSRLNVGEIAEALAAATDEQPSETMKKRFLKLWDEIAPSVQQSLTARMKRPHQGPAEEAAGTCRQGGRGHRSILLELKQAIEAELDEPEYQQLELFSDPEREQFERNKDFLRDRVKQIPGEIERETAAIRARFADPQARMFPVAVTFLVPEKMSEGVARCQAQIMKTGSSSEHERGSLKVRGYIVVSVISHHHLSILFNAVCVMNIGQENALAR